MFTLLTMLQTFNFHQKSVIFLKIIIRQILLLWQTFGKFSKSPDVKTRSCTRFPVPLEITDFSLNEVNHEKTFNKQSLKGHWNLIFFGYTNCPDICPNTMEIIKDVWNNLEKHYVPARFIFITLDPEEDNSKKMRKQHENVK